MKIRERVNKSKSFEMDTYKTIKLLKTKKNVLTCKLNVCLLFMHTVYRVSTAWSQGFTIYIGTDCRGWFAMPCGQQLIQGYLYWALRCPFLLQIHHTSLQDLSPLQRRSMVTLAPWQPAVPSALPRWPRLFQHPQVPFQLRPHCTPPTAMWTEGE